MQHNKLKLNFIQNKLNYWKIELKKNKIELKITLVVHPNED
jgi:hypothetical protein